MIQGLTQSTFVRLSTCLVLMFHITIQLKALMPQSINNLKLYTGAGGRRRYSHHHHHYMLFIPNTWKSYTDTFHHQYCSSTGSTRRSYSRIGDVSFDSLPKASTTLTTSPVEHHKNKDIIFMKQRKIKQIKAVINSNDILPESTNTNCCSWYTSVSFYKFVTINEEQIDSLVQSIKRELVANCSTSNVKGTLIISKEGFNGQFALPSNDNTLQVFQSILESISHHIFNNIDFNIGDSTNFENKLHLFPYKKLIIRKKNEILTDGIEGDHLDWSDAGIELKPHEWHEVLLQDNNHNHNDSNSNTNSNDSNLTSKIVIDCRNKYESDIGMFQGATPLNTDTFSDSWEVLDELLKDTPKDAPILTYCTGGIRCVKVNSYLKQKMGYTNVSRLYKGIIGYEQWLLAANNKDTPSNADRGAITHNDKADNNHIKQQHIPDGNDDNDNVVSITTLTSSQPSMINISEERNTTTTTATPSSLFIGTNFVFDRRRSAVDPSYNKSDHALLTTTIPTTDGNVV